MNPLRLALIVSGLITPLIVGFIHSNAGATDDTQRHKVRIFRDADVEGAYAFRSMAQSSALDPSQPLVLW